MVARIENGNIMSNIRIEDYNEEALYKRFDRAFLCEEIPKYRNFSILKDKLLLLLIRKLNVVSRLIKKDDKMVVNCFQTISFTPTEFWEFMYNFNSVSDAERKEFFNKCSRIALKKSMAGRRVK